MGSISPRIDLAFKKLFGVEENKDLLISLINSIVSEEDQVADITLRNPYNIQNFVGDKPSILDIKAKGLDGKYFTIEMQINDVGDYDKRALYYWSKVYTDQLTEGKAYGKLCKVIGIHILNFFSFPESQSYHNVFYITERNLGFRRFYNFELHTIELKKFQGSESEELSDLVAKINTSLDMWVAFLTRHSLLEQKDLPSTIPQKNNLNKALQVLEVMNFKGIEREIYEGQMKWFRDQISMVYSAEERAKKEEMAEKIAIAQGIEKGIAQGIEKGIAQGIEKGITQGIDIGRQERDIEIAKKLLVSGLDIQFIASTTGLTIEEIKELK